MSVPVPAFYIICMYVRLCVCPSRCARGAAAVRGAEEEEGPGLEAEAAAGGR